MITVTKIFNFCYGHFLPNYEGKCANQHGHNSILEVEFDGPLESSNIEPYNGMVIDFGTIKNIVQPIIDSLDHKNLNDIMPVPTAENIILFIESRIAESEIPHRCVRIRLYETPTSYAEWRRP